MAVIPFGGAFNVTIYKTGYSIPLTAQLGLLWTIAGTQSSYGVCADSFATDQQVSGGGYARANALIKLRSTEAITYLLDRTTSPYADLTNVPMAGIYQTSGFGVTVFEKPITFPPQNPNVYSLLMQSENDFSSGVDASVTITDYTAFLGGYNSAVNYDYGYNTACPGQTSPVIAGTHEATVFANSCPSSTPIVITGNPDEFTTVAPVSINGHLGFRVITSQPPVLSSNVYCVWDSVSNTYTGWNQTFGGAGNVLGGASLNPAIVDVANDQTLVLRTDSGMKVYSVVETGGTETSTLLYSNASGTGYAMLDAGEANYYAGLGLPGNGGFYYLQLNPGGTAYDVYFSGQMSLPGGWIISANQTQGVNPLVTNGSPVFILAPDLSYFKEIVFIAGNGAVLPNASGGIGPDWNYGPDFQNMTLVVVSPFATPPPTSISVSCASPPAGAVFEPYSHTFPATGGTPPYTFSIISGALPAGINLDPVTGTVSGMPTEFGASFPIGVQATDSVGVSGSVSCSLSIAAPATRLTLVCDLRTGAWSQDSYANSIISRCALVQPEGTLETSPETYPLMVMADDKGNVYAPSLTAGDNGQPITALVGTFEWDGQPLRNSGLWESWYLDCVPIYGLTVNSTMFGQVQAPNIPTTSIGATSSRVLVECPVPDGSLNRFLGLQIEWTDQPGAPFTSLHSFRNFADPDSVFSWKTSKQTFGLHGYLFCGRLEMTYSCTEAVTMNLTAFDGTSSATMTMPATGGQTQKILITPTVNKGQLLSFSAASAAPFQIMGKDSLLWLRSWGSTGPWILYPLGAEESVKS